MKRIECGVRPEPRYQRRLRFYDSQCAPVRCKECSREFTGAAKLRIHLRRTHKLSELAIACGVGTAIETAKAMERNRMLDEVSV